MDKFNHFIEKTNDISQLYVGNVKRLQKSLLKKKIEKVWGIVGNFIIFAPKFNINRYTH